MNKYQIFSMQALKTRHLLNQREHLNFVREYHHWMVTATVNPEISDLHRIVADQIDELLKNLDQMIKSHQLQPAASVETTQTPSLSYHDASAE